MHRSTSTIAGGVLLIAAGMLWHVPMAAGQLAMLETPIEQAPARVSGETLTVVRLAAEEALETREEIFTVPRKVAREVIDETTKLPRTVIEEVTETRARVVTVPRLMYRQVTQTFDLTAISASELGGAKLDAAALKTRLAKQGLILIADVGRPVVPEAFKVLFKPETIVLDLRNPLPPADPPPLPVPGGAHPADPELVEGELAKPGDMPPRFRLASIDYKGQFVLKAVDISTLTSTQHVTAIEKRLVDGKEVELPVSKPINVMERRETSHSFTYPGTAITGVTVDGKPLDDRHRAALTEREIPVVIAATGKPVESFWLQNLKPKMLVLTTLVASEPFSAREPPLAPPPLPPDPVSPLK